MKIIYWRNQYSAANKFKVAILHAIAETWRITKIIFWWSLIIASIGTITYFAFPHIKERIVERQIINDTLAEKVTEVQNKIVADIKTGESHSLPESAGLIVFDTNHVASIGNFQFQVKTIQHYYKKFYGQNISQKEAILIALDDTKSTQLAHDILFKEKNGWSNWYNTSKKYNIESRLNLLASIQN